MGPGKGGRSGRPECRGACFAPGMAPFPREVAATLSRTARIRRAFALAIDRDAIVRVAYGGQYGSALNDSHLMAVDPAFVPMPKIHDVAIYFQALQQSVREAGITLTLEERPNDGYIQFRTGDNDLSKGNFHKFAMTAVGNRNPGISLFRMRGANVESGHWQRTARARQRQATAARQGRRQRSRLCTCGGIRPRGRSCAWQAPAPCGNSLARSYLCCEAAEPGSPGSIHGRIHCRRSASETSFWRRTSAG